MELKHIKELMTAMGRTGTKRLSLKKDGFELSLERAENGSFRGTREPLALDLSDEITEQSEAARRATIALSKAKDSVASLSGTPFLDPNSSATAEQEKGDKISSLYVTSPMVGTFYSSPSPDDPPFVRIGDKIDKNTIVCIVEAMKVMNEIKAGVTGTVAEILVDSGHPVEFGTKLYRIT